MSSWADNKARLRRMLDAPLRWPRTTTRRLMILVALVAIGIWAMISVPRAIDRFVAYRTMAESHASREQESSELARASSIKASAIQSQFEEWRRAVKSADELTERYFVARLDFYVAEAKYHRAMAEYHANLKDRYRRARWFPWSSVARESAPPPDPSQSQSLVSQSGKRYEIIMDGATSATFSPSGGSLAVGCRDNTIRLLQLPARKELASFSLPGGYLHSVVFSRDRKTLFALGEGRLVRRRDVATGRVLPPIPWSEQPPGQPGSLDYATAIACAPDGGTIAVVVGGRAAQFPKQIHAVRLLDTRTGALLWEYKGTGSPPHSVAFSPDGQTLAYGSGPAVLLDSRTGELKKTLKPGLGYVIAVAFSSDGRILAGAGGSNMALGVGSDRSGRVTLWDVSTGEILRTMDGPTESAFEVAFSPDGRTVAAGGRGAKKRVRSRFPDRGMPEQASEVRLWNVAIGNLVWTAEGESNSAFSLSFSPDGASLAFCDEDYVFILDAATGRLRQIVMETVTKFRAKD